MDSSSPLDRRGRERIEAGLDIALMALRRIAAATVDEVAPGSLAQTALAQIEAILPEKARR
jgi:hypothetical protein